MTDPSQGFQGLAGQLNAATQQVNQGMQTLSGRVNSGSVRIDPDGLEDCAKFCDDQATQVLEMMRDLNQLNLLGGLGSYRVADGLRQHLTAKATGGGSSAQALLKQLYQELTNQASAFRDAAKDYRDREAQIAHDVGKGAQ